MKVTLQNSLAKFATQPDDKSNIGLKRFERARTTSQQHGIFVLQAGLLKIICLAILRIGIK